MLSVKCIIVDSVITKKKKQQQKLNDDEVVSHSHFTSFLNHLNTI